jgi:hypothetical protein
VKDQLVPAPPAMAPRVMHPVKIHALSLGWDHCCYFRKTSYFSMDFALMFPSF